MEKNAVPSPDITKPFSFIFKYYYYCICQLYMWLSQNMKIVMQHIKQACFQCYFLIIMTYLHHCSVMMIENMLVDGIL